MAALTPEFVFNLETRMKARTSNAYATLNSETWWNKVCKVESSDSLKTIAYWLLSTAQIRDQGTLGGNIHFADQSSVKFEYETKYAGEGLRLRRQQLEDLDGMGIELASAWSRDIGAYMAYWPQKLAAHALRNGHTAALYTAYDSKAFFATDHPVNPNKASAGTYANLLTASDAADISTAVTADVALANLGKVFAKLASVKMPNGEDPRNLRPAFLLVGPTLFPRAVQLTSAKFLAQAASSGGGAADVEAVIRALGYAQPVMVPELAGFESDTTYFVAAQPVAGDDMAPLIYNEREAFKINYYGLLDSDKLGRMDEFEWQARGRNAMIPGQPFELFKVKAA